MGGESEHWLSNLAAPSGLHEFQCCFSLYTGEDVDDLDKRLAPKSHLGRAQQNPKNCLHAQFFSTSQPAPTKASLKRGKSHGLLKSTLASPCVDAGAPSHPCILISLSRVLRSLQRNQSRSELSIGLGARGIHSPVLRAQERMAVADLQQVTVT